MKKIILFIVSFLFISFSYAGNVDSCCIISTLDYKENLKIMTQKIKRYPNLQKRADNTVSKIVSLIAKKPKFRKNKLKLYSTMINKVIDYVYNHNIYENTPSYIMLAYFVYRMQDVYEYEKNTKKYNLEATLENINKNPYTY